MGQQNLQGGGVPLEGWRPPMITDPNNAPFSNQMEMQKMNYWQTLMQEINNAEKEQKGTYGTQTPHDAETVELTTEQVAKIMAAGGSVKIL